MNSSQKEEKQEKQEKQGFTNRRISVLLKNSTAGVEISMRFSIRSKNLFN